MTTQNHKLASLLAAVFGLLIALASPALADTFTWDDGGADSEWFTDGNWDMAGAPDTDDDVVINSGTVEHNGTAVFNSQHLVITTVAQADTWWSDGPPRGGNAVTTSNASVDVEGSLFVGYGSVAGSSWTQHSGSLTIGGDFLIGGNDYDIGGSDGNGTVTMNDGSIDVTNNLHFADGTQLFEQNGGTVTANHINLNPPWHQPVNGSYDMNGGTLTLTGPEMIVDGGESGPNWVFNFGGGDIYLGGDQSDIATAESRFNITGDPQQYQAEYDSMANTTHLFYGSTAELAALTIAPSGSDHFLLTWDSSAGMSFNVLGSPGLPPADPLPWPIYDGHSGIPHDADDGTADDDGNADTTTVKVSRPSALDYYFAIAGYDTP